MVSGIFSIPLEGFDAQTNETHRNGTSGEQTLREYVGSEENRMVKIAADSLLERNSRYNPVVLYGPTGTGKSFLALGLAERWRAKYPQASVIVTCGADFARSYANAVDTDNLSSFRNKSRSADLFVLDDVHSMQHKWSAQSELTRALDDLLQRGRSILVTDKVSPGADEFLQPALRSRLLGGLPVPLMAPGKQACMLLLRRLAALHNVHLSEGAVELLAGSALDGQRRQWTVPQLNHAVIQLGYTVDSHKPEVDIELVRQFLHDEAVDQRPTLRRITTAVARHFSLTCGDLRGPSRRRNVVRARGVAMLLAWNYTSNSLDAVGRYFGKRDHTTVLHACRRTESLQETDPRIANALDELLNQVTMP